MASHEGGRRGLILGDQIIDRRIDTVDDILFNPFLSPATLTPTGVELSASVATAAPTGALIGATHEAAPDDNLLTSSTDLQATQQPESHAGEFADDSPRQRIEAAAGNSKLEPIFLNATTELDRVNTLHIENSKEAPTVSAYKVSLAPQIQAPLASHSEQEQVSPGSAPLLHHTSAATVIYGEQVAIDYCGTDYIVPWGQTVNERNFYILNPSTGAQEQVTYSVAANLFAASQAYSTLDGLATGPYVLNSENSWNNVFNAIADVQALQVITNLASSVSGLFLASLATGGLSDAAFIGEFINAAAGVVGAEFNLAAGASALDAAETGLQQVFGLGTSGSFGNISATNWENPNLPISFGDIVNDMNVAMTSFAVGGDAANAIELLNTGPVSWLNYVSNIASSVLDALSDELPATFQNIYSDAQAANGAYAFGQSSAAEWTYLNSLVTALQANATYPGFTTQGLQTIVNEMVGASYILPSEQNGPTPVSYTITPGSDGVPENYRTLEIEITRSGTASQIAQSQTVYAYTLQDHGVANQNPVTGLQAGDYYYQGLDNQYGNNEFSFAPGQTSILVPITINDLHLTSGAETFGFEITDPQEDTLSYSTFTIFNTDTAETYSLLPAAIPAPENGPPLTFTITRSGNAAAETVYVSTLDNLGTSNGNNYYYSALAHLPVTFAAGSTSATVSVPINNEGLTSGSESFNLVVQPNATDSVSDASTWLISSPWEIVNSDASTNSLHGNVSGTVSLTGQNEITNAYINLINGADVENSGTLTIASGGFVSADNNTGNRLQNTTNGILDISAASSVVVENFSNDGQLQISPGAGNLVVVGGVFQPNSAPAFGSNFSDTGSIEVDSGTLEIFGMGSATGSAFQVASGGTLQFAGSTAAHPFVISGGTYDVAGTTTMGSTSGGCDVVFGEGTSVNIGSQWLIGGGNSVVDLSQASLIGGFSSLQLDAGANLLLGGNATTINNLSMNGSASFTDSAVITLGGTAVLSGLVLGGGEVTNSGSATVDSSTSFVLSIGEVLDNTGTLTVQSGAALGNGAGLLQNEAGANIDLAGAQVSVGIFDNSGVVTASGGSSNISGLLENVGFLNAAAGSVTLTGGGEGSATGITSAAGATLDFAAGTFNFTGGTYNAGGSTDIAVGATLAISGTTTIDASIENSGMIEITAGTLTLEQSPTGPGSILMQPGTTLALANPASLSAPILDYAPGNTIDLLGIVATSATVNSNGQLVVSNGTTTIAVLDTQGLPTGVSSFSTVSDGNGGTNIVWPGNANTAFSISPNAPSVAENSGDISFTVTRLGSTASAETVYVSTYPGDGYGNPDSAYYGELNHVAVTFAAGSAVSSTVTVDINDRDISAGNETFELVAQQNSNDALTDPSTYLAYTPFTINNTDAPAVTLSGAYTGTVTETGISLIAGNIDLDPGVLQNEGTMTVGLNGQITSSWNGTEAVNNEAGATFAIEAATTIQIPNFNNAGLLIVSPGVGETATISGALVGNAEQWEGAFNNTGNGQIEVDSGTLDIYTGGSASASAFDVASGATLLFTGPPSDPFTITSGNFQIAGTISVGSASHGGNLIFGAGSSVNLGGTWDVYDTVNMSAATVTGVATNLYDSGVLYLGANSVTMNDAMINDGSLNGSGTVTLLGGSSYEGNWNGGGTLQNEGALSVVYLYLAGTFVNLGNVDETGGFGGTTATVENAGNATWNIEGNTLYIGAGVDFENAGLLQISPGAGNLVALRSDLENTGVIDVLSGNAYLQGGGSSSASSIGVASGATLSFYDNFTLTGGIYDVQGSTYFLDTVTISGATTFETAIDNSGIISLASGTLTFDQSVTDTGQVMLNQGTMLALASAATFANSISGFVPGAVIDLLDSAATATSINSTGQLVVFDGTTTVAALSLAGTVPAAGAVLSVTGDGAGGSNIAVLGSNATVSNGTICFANGSQITVASGTISGSGTTVTGANDRIYVNQGAINVANGLSINIQGLSNTVVLGTDDSITLGGGNNVISFATALVAADVIVGGAGSNTLDLDGNYSIQLAKDTIDNIQTINLAAGHNYNIAFEAGNVAKGQILTVNGQLLDAGNALDITIDAEKGGFGRFKIVGGQDSVTIVDDGKGRDDLIGGMAGHNNITANNAGDTIVGEGGDNTINGGNGNDRITAGAGSDMISVGTGDDVFVYTKAAWSTSTHFDTITGFNALTDKIEVNKHFAVTGIDAAITQGVLNAATFDKNLTHVLNGHLGTDQAILFTASSGTYAGQTFLIVDQNGKAGYRAGHDLVIDLGTGSHNLADLSVADFVI